MKVVVVSPAVPHPFGETAARGLYVLVVGLLANDSGLAVPGVMLAIAVPVAVLRSDAWLPPRPEAGAL